MTQFLTLGGKQRVNVSHGRLSMDRRSIRPECERCRGLQGAPESACISLSKPRQGQKRGLCTDRCHVDDRESLSARGSVTDCRRTRPGFWWEIFTRVDWQHRLLRSSWTQGSRSRSGVGGWRPTGARVRGRSERREQPRRVAGFLVVEPKNAWGGERVKPGRRVELESVEKAEKPGTCEIPNSSFFRFFPALCTQPVRPCPYMDGLGEVACRGAQILNLLLPSVSRSEKGSPRGGCWKGR
jgi:hypothetical protein